jgi:hypothetical protein
MEAKKERVKLLELEPNIVLLFSAIAIPVVILGALLILGMVRSEMNRVVGEDFLGGAADDAARQLDSYLLNSFTTVSIVAASSDLHQAVARSNTAYREDPAAIQRRLEATDREWTRSRGAVPIALEVVRSEPSEYLRKSTAIHPSYREMLVTDRFGALVAATNIPTDYYQADEEWWRKAFGDGDRGSIHIGKLGFDASAGAHTIEVAVPLLENLDEQTTQVAGVLKTLVGAEEMFSVIGAVKRGETGHALLVSSADGTVIAGREASDVMRRSYPAFSQLQETLRLGGRAFVSQQGDEPWLVAFARLPQPAPAQFGDWLVVVQQRHDEIHAAVTKATTYLVLFFVGMVLLVLAFSLYLHYRLVKPIREIDLREEMERLAESSASS